MGTELFIPKLGQTVEEVTLVKWLLPEGAKVTQGQEVLEVETDKAVFPVEANGKGFLHRGPYQEGQVLPVLEVVAIIGGVDEKFVAGKIAGDSESEPASDLVAAGHENTPSAQPQPAQEKVFASPRARKLAKSKEVDLAPVPPTGGGGIRIVEKDVISYLNQRPVVESAQAPRVTPVAQRVAAAAGLDLQSVSGTGPGGRIVKNDVQRALAPETAPIQAEVSALQDTDILQRIPLKGVRAIIANRMGTSVHTTARVTLLMEVDATHLVEARSRLKEKVEKEWGFAPGYNDILAKIVAMALQKYPYMNARLTPDAIEYIAHINLGLAVDTDRGLVVPVIRDANHKGLREFGNNFRTMVERARQGRALPDDLSGGTFTITNLGMYDVDAFTPVINLPEAAILGVGRINPKPVVYNGAIEIRSMLTLSLVFDHRLVDGAPAAKFLQFIKQVIEEPYLLLAE
jgi:pyruvate dehydrogenase E2 component (dihydrolipoamide acetyltransferase)